MTEQQLSSGEANDNLLHLTWQIAKSRRFAAALRTSAARRLGADEHSDALLNSISDLQRDVTLAQMGSAPGSKLDRTRRLLAFARSAPPATGATPVEQLINLQHAFDQRLEYRLALLSDTRETEIVSLSMIRDKLDERTVLLQLFLGEYADNRAVLALVTDRHRSSLTIVPEDIASMMQFDEAGRTETAYSYANDIYMVRKAVEDGGFEGHDLEFILHTAGGAFLHDTVGKTLDEMHAGGADHLVIVPHGPYHFAPLQLFARGERLLADDWIVTVLPNIEMIQGAAMGAVGTGTAAVYGLGFEGPDAPYGLDPIPGAIDESQRIACVFGTDAVTDGQATEQHLRDTLGSVRYLHLATHGALDLDAPALSYVVMSPAAGSDGVLHAHELLQLDLCGLELVTLSACETALGRLDRADNPRGLPAALLLAGVQTIVGTLWETRSDTSRAFFVEMYKKLKEGRSRRDAFRFAQVDIRRRFPEPRDWAAFYLLGAWG